MRPTGFFFLFMFLLTCSKHLYDSWHDRVNMRSYTKPFLLLFLLLFYVFSASKYQTYLILALIASWIGDLFLIRKGHQWFVCGGISFMVAHVFLILVYLRSITWHVILYPLILTAGVLYYGISVKVIRLLRCDVGKRMLAAMCFYLFCNSTMNLFALMRVCTESSVNVFIAYVGALLFFISDCALFMVRYHSDPKVVFKKHFTVMLTYLMGEFLIVISHLNGS